MGYSIIENGETKNLVLQTHQWKQKGVQGSDQMRERFQESLSLLHFKEAWNDALVLKCNEIWNIFTRKALEHLEVDIAMKACQQSKDIKTLSYLSQLEHMENRALLAGHIFLLFGDHDAAQDAFLKSCSPEAALEMRINLRQWDKALALAIDLGSSSVIEIEREYAELLERREEYRKALIHYERLLKSGLDPKQLATIRAGVARTSIHCGDPWKGRQMAMLCDDPLLYTECGNIFERMNLLKDAAEFFELGGQLAKSISCYIAVKSYTKAFPLLERLASPKCYVEYAKAVEAEGNLADAALAFELAEDYENVVRLFLGPLKNPLKAFSIVYKLFETKSVSGAVLAARFCKNIGDYAKAIEFLILANRCQEAKELAEQYDKMDIYTELVVDVTSKDECLQLARYYETMGEYSKAGALLERCQEIEKALSLYLCWSNKGGIDQAIDLIGREKNDALTHQLLDYLNREEEGTLKSTHLYTIHRALGNFEEATNLISILAAQEQEEGNYKKAHQLLLDFCLVLQEQAIEIPSKILNQLMLLHSYVLVKIHIHLGDHSIGSQLLIRVARNISKFPSHVVPILTSTVIECHRAGLKTTAFEYASMLMCPEYRSLISSAYKRKVEKIVRKCEKVEEEEPSTPCPICASPLPNMQLDCETCGNNIPFCIASGRHMVRGDWTMCSHCKFPALASEYMKVIEVDSSCPMCSKKVSPTEIEYVSNPLVLKYER